MQKEINGCINKINLMIRNTVYRESLERVIPCISIDDGKVLITGATGLIGSCLIDMLMLANSKGRSFDVYALGRSLDKLGKRFAAFEGMENLHFIETDIRQPLNDNIDFDFIIHGASNADPRNYALFPVETMLITLEGATNILNYCKKHLGTKVIMLSTFEVYGNARKDIYDECDSGVVDLNMLRSCYPESKRSMEILTRCYVEEYGVNAVIGRLCSIYGPTMVMDDSKAHAQFIKNALKKEDIILKSKGEQRRTYCYVIDAVTGILCVLSKGTPGESYNISYEKAVVSIAEVAQTIAAIVGSKVIYENPDNVESKGFSTPQNCILNNLKLRSLGWTGSYDIKDGMTECINILMNNNL